MTKTSINLIAVTLLLAGIVAKLRAIMQKQVPVGYQDETGFHFGVQPTAKKSAWPPVW